MNIHEGSVIEIKRKWRVTELIKNLNIVAIGKWYLSPYDPPLADSNESDMTMWRMERIKKGTGAHLPSPLRGLSFSTGCSSCQSPSISMTRYSLDHYRDADDVFTFLAAMRSRFNREIDPRSIPPFPFVIDHSICLSPLPVDTLLREARSFEMIGISHRSTCLENWILRRYRKNRATNDNASGDERRW